MNMMRKIIFVIVLLSGLRALAQDTNGCPDGSYSIIVSPDGTTLSVLFDHFVVDNSGPSNAGIQRTICNISSPLKLPANYSIGVYRVDYRGFAKLFSRQEIELAVQYFLGPHNSEHGRVFKRKIKGPHEDDYFFTETIGAGQMKRVGCGTAAMLNVGITLSLYGDSRTGDAIGSLDTRDAAPDGALIYHLDARKCP